jgi:flavin-dependent dehydrogenase
MNAFDVAIVGGGPAGMAMAIELAPSLAVAVIDAREHRAIRGETLAPGCRPLLARLGVYDAFLRGGHARCEGTMASWGAPSLHVTDYLLHPERNGWRLDRDAFDAMLAAEAERRGATLIAAHARAVIRDGNLWRISGLSSSLIVDATGRQAALARRLGAQRLVADNLVGISGVLEPRAPLRNENYPLIEARHDGWVYSTVAPRGEIVVVAMTDSDVAHVNDLHDADAWRRWIAGPPRTCARVAGASLRGTVTTASACSQRLDCAAGDAWLAVGDAAAAFDPLSSQGIVSALRSGIDAAAAVRAWLAGDAEALARHAHAIAAAYDAYLTTRRSYYAMERRWRDEPFWQRRAA